MNCKHGDLAVMVRSDFPRNVGRLFRVISHYRCDQDEWYAEALQDCEGSIGPIKAGERCWVYDPWLRPIRDQDGEDEILRIAGKPQEVTA